MKLHELKPAEGSKKLLKELVEVLVQAGEKLLEKVKMDKTLDQVVEQDQDLKEVKCLYTEDFLKEVLQIFLQKNILV